MIAFLQYNRAFFTVTISYILIGWYILLQIKKGDETLFLSQYHNSITDYFFQGVTALGESFPYIIGSIFLVFKRYRYTLFVGLVAVVVTIIAALLKDAFDEPRPFTYLTNIGRWNDVQTVDGLYIVKGLSSFPSGHTMSAFAIYGFFTFILPKPYKYWGFLFGMAACAVGLSRIYLAQHFLEDVLAGAIIGIFIAIILYIIQVRFQKQPQFAWWNGYWDNINGKN
jgi:membrane-associated phospholipid phosphatase